MADEDDNPFLQLLADDAQAEPVGRVRRSKKARRRLKRSAAAVEPSRDPVGQPPPPGPEQLAAIPPVRMNQAYADLVSWSWSERYLFLTGGRGSGKSFALALALALLLRQPGYRILYTRFTLVSAEDSIIPEFLQKTALLGFGHEFEQVGSNIVHKVSGSEILFRGIKTSSGNQTGKLKSLTGVNVWVLEEADELADEDTFDTIDLSIRDGRHPCKVVLLMNPSHVSHWIYQRFWLPYRLPEEFTGVSPAGVRHIHTDYGHNRDNLPKDIIDGALRMKEANPARYRRIFLGHWGQTIEGALWDWNMIDKNRRTEIPELVRVVVAVDPSAKSVAGSDSAGLIAAGLGVDGHYYVFEDATMRGTPLAWATAALGLADKWSADRVVAEINNGGEMVELTLRSIDPNVSYRAVTATRGKLIRAEPVSQLYERGMVHHVGMFRELEEEQTTFTGAPSDKSPNRLDALVWAITDLMGSAGQRSLAVADRMTR